MLNFNESPWFRDFSISHLSQISFKFCQRAASHGLRNMSSAFPFTRPRIRIYSVSMLLPKVRVNTQHDVTTEPTRLRL